MYVVIEMQNGIIGDNTWMYASRADAEVKFYQTLAEAVKSSVTCHTVMLCTGEGFVLDVKTYRHEESGE